MDLNDKLIGQAQSLYGVKLTELDLKLIANRVSIIAKQRVGEGAHLGHGTYLVRRRRVTMAIRALPDLTLDSFRPPRFINGALGRYCVVQGPKDAIAPLRLVKFRPSHLEETLVGFFPEFGRAKFLEKCGLAPNGARYYDAYDIAVPRSTRVPVGVGDYVVACFVNADNSLSLQDSFVLRNVRDYHRWTIQALGVAGVAACVFASCGQDAKTLYKRETGTQAVAANIIPPWAVVHPDTKVIKV